MRGAVRCEASIFAREVNWSCEPHTPVVEASEIQGGTLLGSTDQLQVLTLGFAELTGMASLLAAAGSVIVEGTDSGANPVPSWSTSQFQTGWEESPVSKVTALVRCKLLGLGSAENVNVTPFGLFDGTLAGVTCSQLSPITVAAGPQAVFELVRVTAF